MTDIQRSESGHFLPGRSPNPGGRPKMAPEVAALLQELTPAAMKRLGEIALDKTTPPAIAVQACEALLNRALGRAPAALEVSGPNGAPLAVDLPQDRTGQLDIARRVAFLLERGMRAKREIESATDAELVETRTNQEPDSDAWPELSLDQATAPKSLLGGSNDE